MPVCPVHAGASCFCCVYSRANAFAINYAPKYRQCDHDLRNSRRQNSSLLISANRMQKKHHCLAREKWVAFVNNQIALYNAQLRGSECEPTHRRALSARTNERETRKNGPTHLLTLLCSALFCYLVHGVGGGQQTIFQSFLGQCWLMLSMRQPNLTFKLHHFSAFA